jgi:nanoRNase/pAp phosphatase (c-di-AMP/oligoRNAs hydrolase)
MVTFTVLTRVIIFNQGIWLTSGILKLGGARVTNGASQSMAGIFMGEHSAPITQRSRYHSLTGMVSSVDTLGIVIVADPDAIASALTLKRLFWRKVKKIVICRVNAIKRSDNLAMIKLLNIDLPYIKQINTTEITKWATADAQPHHHKYLNNIHFHILIDHHLPFLYPDIPFKDIRESYGATSSIMTEYLRAAEIRPSARLATALFYGIKTDTDNFARTSTSADIKAFRYLYPYVNLNVIKKIESSEINSKNIAAFRTAFDTLQLVEDTAFIHMEKVNETDTLVIVADFFIKMVEASWCLATGIHGQKLVIIIRYAGFRLHAGQIATRLFGSLGSAGGHKNAARAEIPLSVLKNKEIALTDLKDYIIDAFKNR